MATATEFKAIVRTQRRIVIPKEADIEPGDVVVVKVVRVPVGQELER